MINVVSFLNLGMSLIPSVCIPPIGGNGVGEVGWWVSKWGREMHIILTVMREWWAAKIYIYALNECS